MNEIRKMNRKKGAKLRIWTIFVSLYLCCLLAFTSENWSPTYIFPLICTWIMLWALWLALTTELVSDGILTKKFFGGGARVLLAKDIQVVHALPNDATDRIANLFVYGNGKRVVIPLATVAYEKDMLREFLASLPEDCAICDKLIRILCKKAKKNCLESNCEVAVSKHKKMAKDNLELHLKTKSLWATFCLLGMTSVLAFAFLTTLGNFLVAVLLGIHTKQVPFFVAQTVMIAAVCLVLTIQSRRNILQNGVWWGARRGLIEWSDVITLYVPTFSLYGRKSVLYLVTKNECFPIFLPAFRKPKDVVEYISFKVSNHLQACLE